MPTNKTPKILIYDSYMAMIKNSVGTKMFRNFYIKINNKKTDIMEDGNLSCAYFTSSVLHQFQLIKSPHATVSGTIKDMENSDWKKIKQLKEGAVLVWEELKSNSPEAKKQHNHIGFYIGGEKAISNSSRLRKTFSHHFTFGQDKNKNPKRKIESIWWHTNLKK